MPLTIVVIQTKKKTTLKLCLMKEECQLKKNEREKEEKHILKGDYDQEKIKKKTKTKKKVFFQCC
jgi:hypothetical protein